MGLEVIDGTIETATARRPNGQTARYDLITIRTADSTERLENVAVAPSVAEALTPGTRGRFYGYKAFDHRGLYGLRASDGRSAFESPTGNERVMLVAAAVGFAGFLVLLLMGNRLGLLALVLGVLGTLGYVSYRRTRLEARARYDADSGYA